MGGVLAQLEEPPGVDLVAATEGNSVEVWPGDGQGGFACERVLMVADPTSVRLIGVGDVDGLSDIVVGSPVGVAITVLRQ